MSDSPRLPPVLMIHGAGGGGWEWTIWRGVLEAAGYPCQAPDLQPAAAGLAATGFKDYLDQVESRARVAPVPPVLVGASLGGLLAYAVASRLATAALVLVNPLPPRPEIGHCPPQPERPPIVPWRQQARLASSRRAMPEADTASVLFAHRHWRDESGAVLNAACAGLDLAPPRTRLLVLAAADDREVPAAASRALAARCGGDSILVAGGHLAPLLGRQAASCAEQAVAWLNALAGFTAD